MGGANMGLLGLLLLEMRAIGALVREAPGREWLQGLSVDGYGPASSATHKQDERAKRVGGEAV